VTCRTITTAPGVTIISCGRRRREPPCSVPGCTAEGTQLCDFKLTSGKTCDRRLCCGHATTISKNVDHCPAHARLAGACP